MAFDFRGKRAAVIGMARSGIGAARLIQRLGGHALVSDIKAATELARAVEELRSAGIEIETGGHVRAAGERFDLIVLSPGVIPAPDLLRTWREKGTPVWSELELAARVCSGPWIGVSGSNGKTTTVHVIAGMLAAAGTDVSTAGNIGRAWSSLLPAPASRVFVVEVSSFQLEYALALHPRVGVLLNLFENHLDRHGSMEVYAELKSRLLRNQTSGDVAVMNGEDPRVMQIGRQVSSRVVTFGGNSRFDFWSTGDRLMCRDGGEQELARRSELALVGRHNEMNSLAAAAAARCFGADLAAIRRGLLDARPVEHRIEFVARRGEVAYYNDSKSTNMVATMTALDSFDGDVILLFGGRPKKESFAPLAGRFPQPVKLLIVYGEAVPKVRDELPPALAVEAAADLPQALAAAQERARPGDVILLSPGCTSFDQFNNFEERGQLFKSLVSEP